MTEQRQQELWGDGFACGAASSLDLKAVVIWAAEEYRIWLSGWQMGRVARNVAE